MIAVLLNNIPVSNQILRQRYTGRNKVLNSSFIHNNEIKQVSYILISKEYDFQPENWQSRVTSCLHSDYFNLIKIRMHGCR